MQPLGHVPVWTFQGIIYLKPQTAKPSRAALPAEPEAGAPAFKIPRQLLLESYRPLALEGVSLADYGAAAEELILELLRRECLVSSCHVGSDNPESTANQPYTRSIDAVFSRRKAK